MSRHRSAYTEEDLYDYDDDYDDYYDDYEEEERGSTSQQAYRAPDCTLTIDLGDVEKESAVSFILETLQGTEVTKQQVTDAYNESNGNTEAAIDALLHMQTVQKEVDSTPPPTTPTRRDRSNSIGKSKSMTALSPNSAAKARANVFRNMGTSGSLGTKSSEKKTPAGSTKKAESKITPNATTPPKKEAQKKAGAGGGLPPPVPRQGQQQTKTIFPSESSGEMSDMALMGFDRGELDKDGGDESGLRTPNSSDIGPPLALRPVVSSPDLLSSVDGSSSAGGLMGYGTIPLSRSPSSTLLTDNAVLSDEEWEQWDKEDAGATAAGLADLGLDKAHMTMVVAGHVDAGKSTLLGHLLYKAKVVNQRTIHKFSRESAQLGKGSFALAWVTDGSASEREHGVTIDIAEKTLETPSKVMTILDAPGHRDFIPNMISGATFADAALLVIPASPGEYEKAVGPGAQTKEHAILLKALGVNQILVAINKMDMTQPVAWSQQRFHAVRHEVLLMLESLQFKKDNIRFVPCSGLAGGNLVAREEGDSEGRKEEELYTWYDGPSVMEAMDTFRSPIRQVKKPLRALVTSVVSEKEKGVVVRCQVMQGTMRALRGVSLTTCTGVATIRSLVDEETSLPRSSVRAGDRTCVVTLSDRSGRSGDEMGLRTGVVLCKGPPLPPITTSFKASILTMPDITPPVIPGVTYYLYAHGLEVLCVVRKIHTMTTTTTSTSVEGDRGTSTSGGTSCAPGSLVANTIIKRKPKSVPGGRSAVVTIETERPVCMEAFSSCKALGRFALRAEGGTCAVGVVEKIKLPEPSLP